MSTKTHITPRTRLLALVGATGVTAALALAFVGGRAQSAAPTGDVVQDPALGIAVPTAAAERVSLATARVAARLQSGRTLYLAQGRGENEGQTCVFPGSADATEPVPIVCDTPSRASTVGLDLGQSTPQGGVQGVVVRVASNVAYAAEYSVGRHGGSITVNPGGGKPVTMTLPDLAALDARADRDWAAWASTHKPMKP